MVVITNKPFAINTKLTVSDIARQLVYGTEPRIPQDRVLTYKEMQDYVKKAIAIAFGQYIHGIEYGRNKDKFSRIHQPKNGIRYSIVAKPDHVFSSIAVEEKCTFNPYKTRDLAGEIQLQLEGYVCNAKVGVLKIRHISTNAITSYAIGLNEDSAINLINKYIEQTLLPYLSEGRCTR